MGHGLKLRTNRAAHLAAVRQHYPIPGPIPEVQEHEQQIPMRDGENITVRVYTPVPSLEPGDGSPLYIAFHEGGWSMGDLTDEDMNCRMFSKEFGAVCVNVDYRYRL
jgi:acetyl esterase/lipase